MDDQTPLAPSDPVATDAPSPELSAGRFLLAIALLVVLPILVVLPAVYVTVLSVALARGTLLGTLLIDPEVAILSDEFDAEDDDLEELDSAAPAKTYEQVKNETENDTTGDHLSWPDSFFECVICLDVMKNDDLIRRLVCGHVFHSECIAKWYLRRHYRCPLCMMRYIPRDPSTHHSPSRSSAVDSYEWRSMLLL